MNINFCDIIKYKEFSDATYIHAEAENIIEFVLCTKDFIVPSNVNSRDLVVMYVENDITANNIEFIENLCCAGIIIFAKSGVCISEIMKNGMKSNIIISENVSELEHVVRKITLSISVNIRDEVMIKGVTNSLLFKNEQYALLDWIYILKLMQVDIFAEYQVALIILDQDNIELGLYDKIINLLKAEHNMKLYSVWENILVCILNTNINENSAVQQLRNISTKQLDDSERENIKIAVGHSYQGMENLQTSFREAIRAFDMIDVINPLDKVCTYSMLGIYRLLYELNDSTVFTQYCDELFCSLIKSDNETQSELFVTLEQYINKECDIEATATALFIHKNTLRYRLKKIEEIMGVNLQNINTITEIVTAFKIRRLMSILE